MRYDRRKTHPLYDINDTSDTGILTDVIADSAIVPVRIGGVIKSRGPGISQGGLPANRAAVYLRNPYLYKIASGRMTRGGASKFFGSRK